MRMPFWFLGYPMNLKVGCLKGIPRQQATFEFQKPSLSKWGEVHNPSSENEFYLHEKEKSFPYQRLST